MTTHHRVIWTQGLFLQPHHFQQESRFLEGLVDARLQAAGPYSWGFGELEIDESQLAAGRLALVRARGVMPDGTAFSMPDADALPDALLLRNDAQDDKRDVRHDVICLAVPRARTGVTEVDFGDGQADALARYAVQDHALRDQTHATDDAEPVQLGAPRLRLLRQRDATDAYALLGVVRVIEVRDDGQIMLDRAYIAPQSRIDATGQLAAAAAMLLDLVQQRARALAAGMGQLGQGVSEVADFLTLQLLNRHQPLLRQFANAPSVHPWLFHGVCLQLAGELATFFRAERHPPDYPIYRHDDLQPTFAPLMQDLRTYFSTEVQRHAVRIELIDRDYGVRTAVVTDLELLRTAGFVLAVRAQVPAEQLRTHFPALTKLGSVESIRNLVNQQLPGITLRSLAVAPRQLPFHDGSHYFALERDGNYWQQFERSGALALHVAGDFPGLALELWAIRQA